MSDKIILTYGTFDLFHIGHLRILERASSLGDKLIVGVSTDEFNMAKGKRTVIPFSQRAEIVSNIKCVDRVIPEMNWEQKITDIKKYNVDIFLIGDDWEGKFDFLKKYCEVMYLPRTKGVSSTSLKEILKSLVEISPEKIKEAITLLEQILKNFE